MRFCIFPRKFIIRVFNQEQPGRSVESTCLVIQYKPLRHFGISIKGLFTDYFRRCQYLLPKTFSVHLFPKQFLFIYYFSFRVVNVPSFVMKKIFFQLFSFVGFSTNFLVELFLFYFLFCFAKRFKFIYLNTKMFGQLQINNF